MYARKATKRRWGWRWTTNTATGQLSIPCCDGDAARDFAARVNVGMIGINVPIPVPLAYHTPSAAGEKSVFGDLNQHGRRTRSGSIPAPRPSPRAGPRASRKAASSTSSRWNNRGQTAAVSPCFYTVFDTHHLVVFTAHGHLTVAECRRIWPPLADPAARSTHRHLLDFGHHRLRQRDFTAFISLQATLADEVAGDTPSTVLVLHGPDGPPLQVASLIARSWRNSGHVVARIATSEADALDMLGVDARQLSNSPRPPDRLFKPTRDCHRGAATGGSDDDRAGILDRDRGRTPAGEHREALDLARCPKR